MGDAGIMKLFGYLPEALFQPLAGPKRHVYARLLLYLYERVFAARILETPTKDDVLRLIALALSEIGVADELREDDDPESEGGQEQGNYIAYSRLRKTGWLIEEREKWRIYVEMHPDAFMLLGAVSELAGNRLRVAGAVVDVKNNLEAAAREPEAGAQGLAAAHDSAIRFARNMRRILVGMRDVEERILGNPNAGAILRTFFQDFVNGLLISDYKQLKTSNNPYRYRRSISALAGELIADVEKRSLIARAYIDQGVVPVGVSFAHAEELVVSQLEKIRQVFEDVAAFMDRIESFRDRLERRVRTTIHYMDLVGDGSVERIARLIEIASSNSGDEVGISLRSPDSGFPISEKALFLAPPPREPAVTSRFRLPQQDPYAKLYTQATSAFDRMVRISPARLLAFVENKMHGRDAVHSSDIAISTIEELFAFRQLPGLALPEGSATIGAFQISLENGRARNDLIDVCAFKVVRVGGTMH